MDVSPIYLPKSSFLLGSVLGDPVAGSSCREPEPFALIPRCPEISP